MIFSHRMDQGLAKMLFLLSLSLIISLILLACPAMAKELHSDYHYSGDSFVVGGEVITVTHYDFYDTTVILGVNERTYIIRDGECESSATKDYCITDIYQDRENATEDDPIKFQDNKIYAGVEVTIRDRGPDIILTRTFSNTSVTLGQEITISVTIKNNGSEGTDSFIYQETMPDGVIITSASSTADFTHHQLTFEANIAPSSQKTFSYTFELEDYNDFSSFATANYTYEGKSFGLKSSTAKVTIKKPYTMAITLSPASLEAYEEATFSLKLTNTYTEPITVNKLTVKVPSAVSVLSEEGDLEKQGDTYFWNGSLLTGRYEDFSLNLRPLKSGKYDIAVNLSVTAGYGDKFSENKTNLLTSRVKAIVPTLTLSDTSLSEGSNFRLSLAVENQNEKLIFKNIKAHIRSSFFESEVAPLDLLAPDKATTLFVAEDLEAPTVNSSRSIDIVAYGTYETSGGELLNFTKKQALQVTPLNKVIVITQKADKARINSSKNITVDVSIKNNNQEAIQVEVGDSYSEGAVLLGGKTSNTLSFTKAETQAAYTYRLNIPDSYDKPQLLIITTVTIPSKNYTDTSTMNISVNITRPPALNASTGNTTKTTNATNETQAKEPVKKEEKPGFFKRIIDAIRDFFKKLI